jgi:hypothetical protein
MSKALTAWIEGIGFLAPGLPDWPTARAVLRGEQAYAPAPSVLPAPASCRRPNAAGQPGRQADAGRRPRSRRPCRRRCRQLATVFSASGADGHNCHALCEQLAGEDRQISPTRFHNSVHNAAAGYWGIATGAMAPCQVICAYDASFGAGLLDALGQVVVDRQTTLLIAYDSEYPQPLFAKRPVPDVAGVGLVLAPQRTERSLAQITVAPDTANAEPLADAALENLRTAIPALRALPLLRKLALGEGGAICLDYLPPMQLGVAIQPC